MLFKVIKYPADGGVAEVVFVGSFDALVSSKLAKEVGDIYSLVQFGKIGDSYGPTYVLSDTNQE